MAAYLSARTYSESLHIYICFHIHTERWFIRTFYKPAEELVSFKGMLYGALKARDKWNLGVYKSSSHSYAVFMQKLAQSEVDAGLQAYEWFSNDCLKVILELQNQFSIYF